MDTSNRRSPDRGRVNSRKSGTSSGSRDLYSNSHTNDDRDIYTQNRRNVVLSTPQEIDSDSGKSQQKRKKSVVPKALKMIVVFLVLAIASCVVLYYSGGKEWINENIIGTVSFTTDNELLGIINAGQNGDDVVNIALFGLDTRVVGEFADAGSRSDSIMILSIDKKHHAIKVSSIMRDSATYINDDSTYRNQLYKINAAYYYGGPLLAVKTLNELLELEIRDYATVDFANMQHIIDGVGGVDVEITESERVHLNGSIVEQCEQMGITDYESYFVTQSGQVHMNGMQAVAFARVRYVPTVTGEANDYGRTDRQRLVLEKLFEKAIQLDALSMVKTGTQLVKYVETSLDIDDILSLAGVLLRSDITYQQARYPRDVDFKSGGADIWINPQEIALNVDWDSVRESIHQFVYDDIPLEEQTGYSTNAY